MQAQYRIANKPVIKINSPSSKRKLSDGTTSPSSTQLAETVRSDGADTVS